MQRCKTSNILTDLLTFGQLYMRSYKDRPWNLERRDNGDPIEEIATSLIEVATYHMGSTYKKGKMMLLPTNRFQLMSRLSQTYLVDSISRAIDYRLRFHKYHQKDLFGIGTEDEGDDTNENVEIGQKTFLSHSMRGSRRHLRSLAKNGLALVSEYGRPSLFITLTCNPNWVEIVEQLLPGQTAFDRGDIVCQVFYRKLETVLHNIRHGKYFKIKNRLHQYHKIQFEVRVIEYQRRGLPHVHIVIKFEDSNSMPRYEDKNDLAEWIDYHITATYPTTIEDEEPLEDGEYTNRILIMDANQMIGNGGPQNGGGTRKSTLHKERSEGSFYPFFASERSECVNIL